MSGYIYVLKSGDFYKVGRTKNLDERIKRLSIQFPFPVKLVMAYEDNNPVFEEKWWHQEFEDKRVNGEWFALDEDDLFSLGEYIADSGMPDWVWNERLTARARHEEHHLGDDAS